jgi:hypothetical protein
MKTGISNREVIMTIKHSLSDIGTISDETSYSNRELYFLLLRFRAAIIAQKLRDRASTVSRFNSQTISCISVEDCIESECPCAAEDGKSFKKTKYKIPKSIGNFTSVTSPFNHITYSYVEWSAIQDLRNSRFEAERNIPIYTIKTTKDGAYLYLYNDKHGELITVTGIFENPLEVQNFPDCEGNIDNCFSPLDQEFIIDPELLPVIYDMLLNSKYKFRPRITDNYNNDVDDQGDIRPPLK